MIIDGVRQLEIVCSSQALTALLAAPAPTLRSAIPVHPGDEILLRGGDLNSHAPCAIFRVVAAIQSSGATTQFLALHPLDTFSGTGDDAFTCRYL